MSKLYELRERVRELEKLSKADPGESPRETRAGFQMSINQARADLPAARTAYFNELSESLVKVYLTGNTDKNRKFVDLLKTKHLVFESPDFYGEIAARVAPTLGTDGMFKTESWRRFIEVVGDFSRRYGVTARTLPREPAGAGAPTFVELRNLMKKTVEDSFGYDLTKAFISEQVYHESFKTESQKSYALVPIFVDNLDERDMINASMFNKKPSYTVTFGENEDPTEEMADNLMFKVRSADKMERKAEKLEKSKNKGE